MSTQTTTPETTPLAVGAAAPERDFNEVEAVLAKLSK